MYREILDINNKYSFEYNDRDECLYLKRGDNPGCAGYWEYKDIDKKFLIYENLWNAMVDMASQMPESAAYSKLYNNCGVRVDIKCNKCSLTSEFIAINSQDEFDKFKELVAFAKKRGQEILDMLQKIDKATVISQDAESVKVASSF